MKRRIVVVLLALAVVASGAYLALAQTVTVADHTQIAKLREEAKALVREQMELSWERRTTGKQVDIAGTYKGHEALFSLNTVRLLERTIAATPQADKKKALEFFRLYVLGEMVNARVAGIDDEVQGYLAGASFAYGGREYNYYQHQSLLQEETEYAQRQIISDAVKPILLAANEKLEQKEERMQRLATALGFADYIALSEQLRQVNLTEFAVQCQAFLDQTEQEFITLLRWAVPFQLGFPAEKARRCDLARLVKNVRYEGYFTKDDMAPRMRRFLNGLGLSLDKVKVDDADRPQKNPRAACYPLDVPDDVRLTIKPAGGQSDYHAFWHEMGHAQHFANATTDVWEFQQLGDNVTTETYAFLFDTLLGNDLFLQKYVGMDNAGDRQWHVRYNAFLKLYMVRRFAAKVLYEIELHRGASDPAGLYRKLLGRAYGIEMDADDGLRYLVDVDDFFYSADYTRAWFAEAMLEAKLTELYGGEWFAQPEAGAYLRKLWATGQFYRGEELVRQIGYAQSDPTYFIERIRRRVKVK